MNDFSQEVAKGKRFEFGKNWWSFLKTLDEGRIKTAEQSLRTMLEVENLQRKTFLDIGSGSGLFSLAAKRLGATVWSFDYDPMSVACAEALRERFYPGDTEWRVERGSILDGQYLATLGRFDVVYSWGVLHHTGNMWQALENVSNLVQNNGRAFIAIYNDQGCTSRFWLKTKQIYCSSAAGRVAVSSVFVPVFFASTVAGCLVHGENLFATYRKNRGMSMVHDWLDWLGGLPFEVAKAEEVFHFFRRRGFKLLNLRTTRSLGNNEFVFVRE